VRTWRKGQTGLGLGDPAELGRLGALSGLPGPRWDGAPPTLGWAVGL
jgi:hypothetical protein